MNKVMFATIIGILGCSPLISCANTALIKVSMQSFILMMKVEH